MTTFVFADYYATAGLAPSGDVIVARETPTARIVKSITSAQILDLVQWFYDSPALDLTWFRNEYAKEDAGFSLINNERETRVLAAAVLEQLVAKGVDVALLAVVAGRVNGHRVPLECEGLVDRTLAALGQFAVSSRVPKKVEARITSTSTPKLDEEVASLAANDWANLNAILTKVRAEAQNSQKTIATQASTAITELNTQIALLREEGQMLWWILGGHSRSLGRQFASLGDAQAAVIAAVDLADLTPVSRLGPVAAPAMLDRIIALAKRSEEALPKGLAETIDAMQREDLQQLNVLNEDAPARLIPVSTAIELARTIGSGSWHTRFEDMTGLKASIEFEPSDLATQLYRERLLGDIL